jgi:hypothetical protein
MLNKFLILAHLKGVRDFEKYHFSRRQKIFIASDRVPYLNCTWLVRKFKNIGNVGKQKVRLYESIAVPPPEV